MAARAEPQAAPRPSTPGGGPARRLAALPALLLGVLGSSMFRYIARRVAWGIFLLFVVTAITFLIFDVFPSADPAALRAGRQANPQLIAQIRHALGLDDPLYEQYWIYLKGLVLHFDLGYSYQNNVSVTSQILTRLPVTISLTVGAFIVWMLIGIPLGILSAIRRQSGLDRGTMGLALLAISAPVYWLGLIVLLPLRRRHRKGPPPARRGELRPDHPGPEAVVPLPRHALVRAGRVVRGHLRAHGAREPDRGDGRGLRPHGAGQGPLGAAGDPPPRPPGRDHARRHAGRSRSRDPARGRRSSRRRCSTFRGSGATPTTPSSTPTCPRSRAQSCSAPSSSSSRTSSSTSSTRSSTRGSGTLTVALLEIEDLRVRFQTRDGVVRAVEGVSLLARPGPDAGHRRGVRLGQERDRVERHGPVAAAQRDRRGPRPLRRRRSPVAARRGAHALPREADRHDLPGPDVVAPPALQSGVADRRGDPRARGRVQVGGPAARPRRARRGGDPEPVRAAGQLSARALGRDAAAGDDRDGARAATRTCSSPTSRRPRSTSPCRCRSSTSSAGSRRSAAPPSLLITHDLGVVAETADEVGVMYAGRVVELGPMETILGAPEHPYTWGLIESLPRLGAARSGRLHPIAGQPPSLIHVPQRLSASTPGVRTRSRSAPKSSRRCSHRAPATPSRATSPPPGGAGSGSPCARPPGRRALDEQRGFPPDGARSRSAGGRAARRGARARQALPASRRGVLFRRGAGDTFTRWTASRFDDRQGRGARPRRRDGVRQVDARAA